MVRDEAFFLPIWVDHYAAQLGAENLFVVDHASDPRVMAVLRERLPPAVNILRVPEPNGAAWTRSLAFDRRRFVLLNGIVQGLRAYYDTVIHSDVDEIVVPDPAVHGGLVAHAAGAAEGSLVAGVGIELLHDVRAEGPFDPDRPLFTQRRSFRYRFRYSKPHVVSGPEALTTHGCDGAFVLDPDLYHVHLKYFDRDAVVRRQERVHGLYEQGLGGRKSRWQLDREGMAAEFEEIAALPRVEKCFAHKAWLRRLFGARGPVRLLMPVGERHNEALKHLPKGRVRRLEAPRRRLPRRFAEVGKILQSKADA